MTPTIWVVGGFPRSAYQRRLARKAGRTSCSRTDLERPRSSDLQPSVTTSVSNSTQVRGTSIVDASGSRSRNQKNSVGPKRHKVGTFADRRKVRSAEQFETPGP